MRVLAMPMTHSGLALEDLPLPIPAPPERCLRQVQTLFRMQTDSNLESNGPRSLLMVRGSADSPAPPDRVTASNFLFISHQTPETPPGAKPFSRA